jgi:hypothetical protein
MTGNNEYYRNESEFATSYSVLIAFMTSESEDNLVYVPCKYESPIVFSKAGSISSYVDSDTGAPLGDGILSENNNDTLLTISKMVASAMV